MKLLLIDTSSSCVEFGFAEDRILKFSYRDCEKNSADKLAYYVRRYFDSSGISPMSVDAVSLSNGPGSFTGLRIGSALAKGFCFGTGSRLLQVNSIDVLAGRASDAGSEFVAAISSNSGAGEFYCAVYKSGNTMPERVSDYMIMTPDEINARHLNVCCESANEKLMNVFEPSENSLQSHLALALDLHGRGFFTDPGSAEPFYMKTFTAKK